MADTKLKVAPVDLDTIKDDLGIPADDTTNDAWLQRRIAGIWSRFQIYTGRPLQLVGPWIDDWSEIAPSHFHMNQPPILNERRRASTFLRVFPVKSIDAILFNLNDGDPDAVVVDNDSGRVLSLGTTSQAMDCAALLLTSQAVITYQAGFDEVPSDLYEALLGCLAPTWATRQAQQMGLGMGNITRIATTDVGEVDFSEGLAGFAGDAAKKAAGDPLIGPWSVLLDPYVDWRAFIGGDSYPTTRPGPAP
jgi:hypothetical protein